MPDSKSKKEDERYEKLETLGKMRKFNENENVVVRLYNNKEKWVVGKVKKLGNLNYETVLNDGNIVRRHIDQIQGCKDPVGSGKEKEENTESVVLPDCRSRGKPPEKLDL